MNLKLSRTALRELTRLYRGVLLAAMVSAAFVASGAQAEYEPVETRQEVAAGEEKTYENNSFTGLKHEYAGGALSTAGTVSISDSKFDGNSVYRDTSTALGGAIYATGTAKTTITDTLFTGNTSNTPAKPRGGAIHNSGDMSITGSTFTKNKSVNTTENGDMMASAIYHSTKELNLTDNIFGGDTVADGNVGNSVVVSNNGTINLSGNTFKNNTIYKEAALQFQGKNAKGIFTDENTFDSNKGGAIYNWVDAQITFKEGSKTNFINNDATWDKEDVSWSTPNGGAIFNTSTVTFEEGSQAEFTENKAVQGGAIFNNTTGQLTVADKTKFTANAATDGGAVYNEGTMTVGGTFDSNVATKEGGAIYNSGNLTVSDGSLFKSNSANMGAGIANHGSSAVLEIGDDVTFQDNFLTGDDKHGSVLYNKQGSVTIGDNFSMEKSSLGSIHDCGIYSNEGGSIEIGDNFSVNNFWEAMVIAGNHNLTIGDNLQITNGGKGINLWGSGVVTAEVGESATFENNRDRVFEIKDYANTGSKITFGDGLVVRNNNNSSADYFGNIYNSANSEMVFDGKATFENNSTQRSGGNAGVFQNWNKLTFNGETEFLENSANGVAGALRNRGVAAVSEFNDTVSFTENKAYGNGGAIINEGTVSFAKEASFSGNIAGAGQDYVEDANGIYAAYDDETEEELGRYKLVLTNEAVNAANGGAIHNTNSVTFADKTSFTDNAAGNLGGAIYNALGGNITFKDSAIFSNNTAGEEKNDIYNAGTINLTAGTGKTLTMALDGGIDGSAGSINLNGAGSVTINGTVKNQGITVASGEMLLDSTKTTLTDSTVAVNSGALLNTIDATANNYAGVVTLQDGANIALDADFNESGAYDQYTIADGATVNITKFSLLNELSGGVSERTLTIGANEKGNIDVLGVKDSVKAYTSDNTFVLTGNTANNGTISLVGTGASTGFDMAVDDTDDATKSEVVYDITKAAGETFTNGDKTIANADFVVHGNGNTIAATTGVESIIVKDNSTLTMDNTVLESFEGPAINNAGETTLSNVTFAATNAQAIKNTGYMKILNSNVYADVDNRGIFISDPTTYSGTFNNDRDSFVSFDADTFTATGVLANAGDVELSNGVTFESGAQITGDGKTTLVSGTTHFNNTANTNDVWVDAGADFDGALVGGALVTENQGIDSFTGSIQNADLYLDAKLGTTNKIDSFADATGSTVKEIIVLGTGYGTADSVDLSIGGATLDPNVTIYGSNYYTSVVDNGNGTITLSDKLINTSTLRGTGDGSTTFVGDVVIGDKADTTTIGTANVNIALDETNKTIDIASGNPTNGAIIGVESGTTNAVDISAVDSTTKKSAEIDVNATSGKIKLEAVDTGATKTAKIEVDGTNENVKITTGSNTATLTGTANGLNVAEGLTVNGNKFTVAAATGNTTVGGTLGVTGTTTLSATNGLQFGTGQNVKAIDAGSTSLTTKDATTLATVGTVLKSAENADFTVSGATGSNITGTQTINSAIDTLDAAIGNLSATGLPAGTTVSDKLVSVQTELDAAETALGVLKADGTYDNTVLTSGLFKDGTGAAGTSLSGSLNNMAANIGTQTTAFADGALAGKTIGKGDSSTDTTVVGAIGTLNTTVGSQTTAFATGTALAGKTIGAGAGTDISVAGAIGTLNDAVAKTAKIIGTDPTTLSGGALNGMTIGSGTGETTLIGAIDTLSKDFTNGSIDASFKTLKIDNGSQNATLSVNSSGEITTGNANINVGTGTVTAATLKAGTNTSLVDGTLTVSDGTDTSTLTKTALSTTTVNATTVNAGTNGTALTDGQLVLNDGTNAVTLGVDANGLTVDKALTIGSAAAITGTAAGLNMNNNALDNVKGLTLTDGLTSPTTAAITVFANSDGDSVVDIASDYVTTTEFRASSKLTVEDASHNELFMASANGIEVNNNSGKTTFNLDAADGKITMKDATGTNSATLTATASGLNVAEGLTVATNKFTADNSGNVTAAGTLTADGQSKFGKDTSGVYSLNVTNSLVTANKEVDALGGVKFGTASGEKVMTSVKQDAVAALNATGNDQKLVSAQAVAATREAINADANTVLGGIYKIDSTAKTVSYDNTVLAGNGFKSGANLSAQLNDYAADLAAATGLSFNATTGANTTTYTKASSTDYDGINANSSLRAAIEQLDGNIGTAMTVTGGSRTTGTFQTGATKTVNQNLSALDAAIGVDMTAIGTGRTTTAFQTAAGNSVNANLTALDATIGADMTSVTTRTVAGGTTATSNTINQNLSALDAAIGGDVTTIATTTVVTGAGQDNGVSASNTVNQNISNLNAAVGDVATLSFNPSEVGTKGSASTGNALAKRDSSGNITGPATTVVEGLNNIDATLGTIHGLKAKLAAAGQDKRNLADGTTVEDHLTSLDAAIGDRGQFAHSNYMVGDAPVADAMMSLDHNLHRTEKEMRGGFASVAAMSALVPNARAAGDTQISVGVGAYRDHQGMAVGAFHYFNDNVLANFGASYGGDKSTMFRAGVTFGW